jgi:DNA-binding PadR family transcriptional regulator
MARARNTQFPILGLLSIQPMSGYDIRCEIEQTLRFFWRESEGQIYPALKELEGKGNIERVQGRGKQVRARQLYAITESGRMALREWVAAAPQEQSPRNEFLLKILLTRYGPPGASLEHIRTHRQHAAERLAAAAQLQKMVRKNSSYPDFPVWMALFRYGVLLRKAEIAWCDETLRALRKFDTVKASIKRKGKR